MNTRKLIEAQLDAYDKGTDVPNLFNFKARGGSLGLLRRRVRHIGIT